MLLSLYTGDGRKPADHRIELPKPARKELHDPAGYIADEGLRDAANVALLLGQPLLLTGEPGTGKTEFAYSVAWELGLEAPLKFETKSTSVSSDLFYTYDTVGRFHAVQTGERNARAIDYVTYNALGLAILCTNPPNGVKAALPKSFENKWSPRRSVVLIDEIDKAPRDFPNDMLNEIAELYFRMPEVRNLRIDANKDLAPVVMITSNSEKHLPDAFLRRCMYYDIPFPDTDHLREIVSRRIGQYAAGSTPLLESTIEFFQQLRQPGTGLRKRPGTAELLDWLLALARMGAACDRSLGEQKEFARRSLNTLLKMSSDCQIGRTMLEHILG